MHKLPKHLFAKKPKRAKPLATGDPDTPTLGTEFARANQEPVPHKHHGDAFAEIDPGLQALNEIFKWIRGESADLIDKINQGIDHFKKTGSETNYQTAVTALEQFVNDLNDETKKGPTGSFGSTINFANIEPIQDSSGFYTSAKVVVQWLGGTHSDSSMIHVP